MGLQPGKDWKTQDITCLFGSQLNGRILALPIPVYFSRTKGMGQIVLP